MLKVILLLLLTFCFSADSYAQYNLKDSLKTLLKKEKQDTKRMILYTVDPQTHIRDSLKLLLQKEKTDTGRVLLLADLCYEYIVSKPDTVMILALEALSLSRQIRYDRGEAISLNRIGNAFDELGNYPKAMESFLQALKINERIRNIEGKGRNLGNIGQIYNNQGEYKLALEYLFQAKAILEKYKSKLVLSITLYRIGTTYLNLKKFNSANLFAQKAHDLARENHVPLIVAASLNTLGDIHSQSGQNKLALEYYRLSVLQSEKIENYLSLGHSYLGMAKLFEKNGDKDSSLIYARHSFIIVKETGFNKQIHDASNFLASKYRGTRNLDSAFYYQDFANAAYDSLFSRQKVMQFQSLAFDEKLRQLEIAKTEIVERENRRHNLQYAAIAISLITFIILFFSLSRSIIVKTKFIEFFGVLGLLAVFEFINLFIHPYLEQVTHHSPVLMLLILIAIGSMLVPLHHKLEKWITKVMVEKNKKIRLNAAKKTIANLEPAFAETAAGKTEQTI
ncbi:MAG: tetratricopeptide repeat protein [Bacteroidota bacterium]